MRSRITRRSLLSNAWRAGVGASGLALVGCGGEDDERPRQPAPARAVGSVQQADQQDEPDFGLPDELGQQQEQDEPPAAQSGAAAALAELDVVRTVDPLEWRERYHWRKLRDAPGRPAQRRRGGELTFPAPGPYGGDWSPLHPPNQPGGTSLLPLFYSQLVEMTADDLIHPHRNEIVGDLAESWETPDEQTLSFTVRSGAIWPALELLESRELTVEDVAATHETYRTADLRQRPLYSEVERIESDPAARSVAFRLAAPNAALLNQLTSPLHVVLRREIVADRAMWPLAATPAGTGPFVLDSWGETGSSWRASRNPEYFKRDERGAQLPWIDAVNGRYGLSRDVDGELDFFNWEYDGGIDQLQLGTPEHWQQVIDARPASVTQVSPPTPGAGLALYFRSLGLAPFHDARVRTAISRSIDREQLAQWVYNGLAAPDCGHNWTFVADPASEWGFREWPWSLAELGESFQADAQAGRALLAAAGYSAAQPLPIHLDAPPDDFRFRNASGAEHPPLTEFVEHSLRESLGDAAAVELAPRLVEIENQGGVNFHRIGTNPNANLLFGSGAYEYAADPDSLIQAWLSPAGAPLSRGITDDELVALAEAQRRALDPLERSALLEQLRLREAEQVWRLPLVNPYGLSVRREYVFDKVDTYFGKDLWQRPRQLERVWRSE